MPASLALTSTVLVKQRLGIDAAESQHDDRIDALIDGVSQEFEEKTHRLLKQEERTAYLDGPGTARLMLRHGPLVSVASVYLVTYREDPASPGDREEVTTEVEAWEFLEDGVETDAEDEIGPGWLVRTNGIWTRGVRNYKVTYTGGFGLNQPGLPNSLKGIGTTEVAVRFLNREAEGLISKSVGDGSLNPAPAANRAAAWDRACRRYRIPGGS